MANVVHLEIPADDTSRARGFWGELLGLEFQTFEGPFEYHMFGGEDQTGGGLMPRQPGQNGLVVYFGTDDIDATARKVAELGGTVKGDKQPVGGMGWTLQVQDPEGNHFAFWQPDDNAPEQPGG